MLRIAMAFLFSSLRLASGLQAENKKTGYFVPGFFLVEERGEISNLDLIRDISDLIKLADSFPISPDHME
jgi:hypothetical protein